jgi:hypothetical protein
MMTSLLVRIASVRTSVPAKSNNMPHLMAGKAMGETVVPVGLSAQGDQARSQKSQLQTQAHLVWSGKSVDFVPGTRSRDLEKARIERRLAAIFAADVALGVP